MDGSGAISTSELGAVLGDAGVARAEAETLQPILHRIDLDGNGTIDFDEFYGSIRTQLLAAAAEGERQSDGVGLLSIFSQSATQLSWLNPSAWFGLPSGVDEDEAQKETKPPTSARGSPERRPRSAAALRKLEQHREALRRIMQRKHVAMVACGLKYSPDKGFPVGL